jgi:hypothetical protein
MRRRGCLLSRSAESRRLRAHLCGLSIRCSGKTGDKHSPAIELLLRQRILAGDFVMQQLVRSCDLHRNRQAAILLILKADIDRRLQRQVRRQVPD